VPGLPEAWRLQLVTINKNLRAKFFPSITHDFELKPDSL